MSVSSLEDRDHLREPELRDRADLSQPLQAAEGVLDGEGDLPLDLLGRERGGDGVDLDLDRRRVGEGVQRQSRPRPDARATTRMPARSRTTNRFFRLNPIRALSIGDDLSADVPRGFSRCRPAPSRPLNSSDLSMKAPRRDDPLARLPAPDHLDHVVALGRPGHDPLRAVGPRRPAAGTPVGSCRRPGPPPSGPPRASCSGSTWICARPNWLARSRPSGFASSARTRVVRVVGLTSVPTQVTLPAKTRGLGARDGERHRLARRDRGDVRLVDVDPEPHLATSAIAKSCVVGSTASPGVASQAVIVPSIGATISSRLLVSLVLAIRARSASEKPRLRSFCSASIRFALAWFRAVRFSSSFLAGSPLLAESCRSAHRWPAPAPRPSGPCGTGPSPRRPGPTRPPRARPLYGRPGRGRP